MAPENTPQTTTSALFNVGTSGANVMELRDPAPALKGQALHAHKEALRAKHRVVQTGVSTEYTCPICKYNSDDKHCFHYGGISCYSCRAFFRRAHQTTKRPNFRCKRSDDCEISVKTRRKCQSCRYKLCLNAGMDPDLVLDNDQKKIRFRNYLKKKAAHNDNTSDAATNNMDVEPNSAAPSPDLNQERRDSSGAASTASCYVAPKDVTSNIQSTANTLPHHYPTFAQLQKLQSVVFNPARLMQEKTIKNEKSKLSPEPYPIVMADQRRRIGVSHIFGNQPNEPSCMPILAMIKERQAANEERIRQELKRQEEEKRELANHLIAFKQQRLSPQFSQEFAHDLRRPITPEFQHQTTLRSFSPVSAPAPPAQTMDHQLEAVQQGYFLAMAEIDISPEFINELQVLHSIPHESNLTKQDFAEHIFRIASEFRQFAKQHEHFKTLSKADQDVLLSHNSALFVFYILSRYLGASHGEEQLQWLLDVNMPQNYSNTKPQKLSLANLDSKIGLFAQDQDKTAIYTDLAACSQNVVETGITLRYSGLVANLLLFNSDFTTKLENPTKIHARFIGAIDLLKHAHQQICTELQVEPMLQMIKHLESFGQIFNANIDWPAAKHLPFAKVNLPHTKEEERFVSSTLVWYSQSFASNPADKRLMGLFLQKSFRNTIPQDLATVGYKFYKERMLAIQHGFSEFQELPAVSQQSLWDSNGSVAIALVLARLETCESGWEQTRVLFGCPEDNHVWENMLAGVINPQETRRVSLAEENDASRRYTDVELDHIYKLLDRTKLYIRDEIVLKLLTAVLLLQGAPLGSSLDSVLTTHHTFLQRRLVHISDRDCNGENLASWIVTDLRELSLLTCRLEL